MCVCVLNLKESEGYLSMGSPLDGAPPGLKSNRGHRMKDNLGCYIRRPLKRQRERKKGGVLLESKRSEIIIH